MTKSKRSKRVRLGLLIFTAAALSGFGAQSHETKAAASKAVANPRLLWTYDAGG